MSAAYLKQYTCEIIIFRMANSCRKETGHDSNGRRRFQSMNELASRIMFKTDLILNKSIIPGEKKTLLFTLGSVYSTNASGAEQITETNNLNQT